jgi:LysR family hydrogen peroxide-inducible transcriptional activator
MARSINPGVIPTLGPYYLPHVLPSIHQNYSKLRLLLREKMTQRVLEHLGEGRLDAGRLALPLPVHDPAMECAELFREPFVAALPSNHPLASAKEVRIDDLADAGLFLLEEGHCLRNHALEACHLTELANEEVRATSLETLRQMVGLGLGVTLIPAMAGAQNGADSPVALRPLAPPGTPRIIGLVWRRRSPIAPTMQHMAALLKRLLPAGTMPMHA